MKIRKNKRHYIGYKIKVRCNKCKREIGYKIKNRYYCYLAEQMIQISQGEDKPFLNFCSDKCEKIFKSKLCGDGK